MKQIVRPVREQPLVIWRPGMKNRIRYHMDTVFNSAVRLVIFVVPVVVGAAAIALAVAACTQNVPRIKSAAEGSRPAPTGSANGGRTACPSQGVGGDSLPPLCAPSSPASNSLGIDPLPRPAPRPLCANLAVTGVSPSRGSAIGGEAVTITGTGFDLGDKVLFGGTPAQSAIPESDTEIIATSPPEQPGQPTVHITVSCDGILSAAVAVDRFSYRPATTPSLPTMPPSSATPPASP